MAINDLYEIAIRGVCLGQPIFNVFHYTLTNNAGGEPTLAEMAIAFRDKIKSSLLALANQLYSITEFTTQLRVASGASWPSSRGILHVLSDGGVGLGTSEVLPLQCAVFITLYASIDASHYLRGGKFIGAINEGAQANGQLTSSALTVAQTLAGKFTESLAVGAAGASTLAPAIYSPSTHRAGLTPIIVPITSYAVNSGIKTLRRRVLGSAIGGY